MPCGGSWGSLQPAPHGMLPVVGKLFFMGLMRDFFVQLVTLGACLEPVGASSEEKSRFCLLFPPGTSAAGAEAGQSSCRWLQPRCSPVLLWPGACQGKGPRFSHSCLVFL